MAQVPDPIVAVNDDEWCHVVVAGSSRSITHCALIALLLLAAVGEFDR